MNESIKVINKYLVLLSNILKELAHAKSGALS
jgi:hypothetical protein